MDHAHPGVGPIGAATGATPWSVRLPHVVRAGKVALVVGPTLVAINHFDEVLAGRWAGVVSLKSVLTLLVPFLVSWHSSSAAARARRCGPGAPQSDNGCGTCA